MIKLDMGVGNPHFLQEYWAAQDIVYQNRTSFEMHYRTDCGIPALINSIKAFHKQIGNVLHVDDWDVVVGHGATQLVEAALYSYKFDRTLQVYARSPHFQRFESMVKACGRPFKFIDDSTPLAYNTPTIEINTWPSNPENKTYQPEFKEVIYDCSYLWPTYTDVKSNRVFFGDMYIFSLAKLSGHASTRIGWAFVKDRAAADLMREFIETQTGDVSYPAQVQANHVIDHLSTHGPRFFKAAKEILDKRFAILKTIGPLHSFKIHNNNGMFAWCEFNTAWHANQFLTSHAIHAILGPELGSDARFVRLNLGCSESTWNEFIKRTLRNGELEEIN